MPRTSAVTPLTAMAPMQLYADFLASQVVLPGLASSAVAAILLALLVTAQALVLQAWRSLAVAGTALLLACLWMVAVYRQARHWPHATRDAIAGLVLLAISLLLTASPLLMATTLFTDASASAAWPVTIAAVPAACMLLLQAQSLVSSQLMHPMLCLLVTAVAGSVSCLTAWQPEEAAPWVAASLLVLLAAASMFSLHRRYMQLDSLWQSISKELLASVRASDKHAASRRTPTKSPPRDMASPQPSPAGLGLVLVEDHADSPVQDDAVTATTAEAMLPPARKPEWSLPPRADEPITMRDVAQDQKEQPSSSYSQHRRGSIEAAGMVTAPPLHGSSTLSGSATLHDASGGAGAGAGAGMRKHHNSMSSSLGSDLAATFSGSNLGSMASITSARVSREAIMEDVVDILHDVMKERRAPEWQQRLRLAVSVLRARVGLSDSNVRQTLVTEAQGGDIDSDTVAWVTSTLRLQASSLGDDKGVTPAPRHLASMASTASMVARERSSSDNSAMGGLLTWDFDIFALVKTVPNGYLRLVTKEILSVFDLVTWLNPPRGTLDALLDKLELTYCYDPQSPNPYHNGLHAADVLQAVAVFCEQPAICEKLSEADLFSLLFAAVAHDYRHPGVSNNFLMDTSSTLAIRYNDDSVLECFHSASAFEVVARSKYNIFGNMSKDVYRGVRGAIIQCILATDLAKGNRHIGRFRDMVLLPSQVSNDNLSGSQAMTSSIMSMRSAVSTAGSHGMSRNAQIALMQMVLKCGDVSHATRPMKLHVRWSNMITAEFYAQGDLERTKGMKVSPLCERASHDLSKSQVGFINFVVRPAFSSFTEYIGEAQWLNQLESNAKQWRDNMIASNRELFEAPTDPSSHGVLGLIPTSKVHAGSSLHSRHGRNRSLPSLQASPGDTLLTSIPSAAEPEPESDK